MKLAGVASTELLAAYFGLLKISHESGNQAADFAGHFAEQDKIFFGEVSFIAGDIQLIPNFAAGTFGVAEELKELDRKSTRLNSSHIQKSRMPSSA